MQYDIMLPMLSHTLHKANPKSVLYILNFLLGMHIALIVYFNASFLESKGISDEYLGSLFIIGSIMGMVVYYILPKLLTKLGVYKLVLYSTIIEILLFIGIGHITIIPIVLLLFSLSLATYIPISYGLDILLEAYTTNESDTGNGRSSFLTMINFAYVISPFIAGVVLSLSGFPILYTLAAIILIPFVIIFKINFNKYKSVKYNTVPIFPTLKLIYANANLFNIFIIQFLIRFFFAWMVVYTPIYLIKDIGFSLADTGLIFSIILIPFILLEIPLGRYVDKLYGEKEFLIFGFLIMAISSYILSFITSADLALWILILFITRIGAAIIEIMNEIYFFKQVDNSNADTISIFRMLSPLAYIVGPALGSIFLFFIPMQLLFGIMGIILLLGVFISIKLKDTK